MTPQTEPVRVAIVGAGTIAHGRHLPMQRGQRPVSSGHDGRRSMELSTGLYRAAVSGRPVLRADLGPDSPHYARPGGELAAAGRRR